jgi:hypothetical protein
MGFLKNLKEQINSQRIFYNEKSKYETRFKVEGETYAFLAETVAGDCDDDYEWMLYFENIQLHRLSLSDNDNKVIKSFVEAVDQWVKASNPYSFVVAGDPCEVSSKIIEGVKKKVKKYNVIDETSERKDESGNIIPGNPVGKVKWTKMVVEDSISTEEMSDTKQSELEKTFEEPTDSKANKNHMTYKKDDKLDKNDKSYDIKLEWNSFKSQKLNEENDPDYKTESSQDPINNPDYKYYVLATNKKTGKQKIDTGWEYREDAMDQVKELQDSGISSKIYTALTLKQKGFDVNDNSSWGNVYRVD